MLETWWHVRHFRTATSSIILSCLLSKSTHTISLVKFGNNLHSCVFQKAQICIRLTGSCNSVTFWKTHLCKFLFPNSTQNRMIAYYCLWQIAHMCNIRYKRWQISTSITTLISKYSFYMKIVGVDASNYMGNLWLQNFPERICHQCLCFHSRVESINWFNQFINFAPFADPLLKSNFRS